MKQIPSIVMYVLIALAIVVLGVCCFGSSESVTFDTGETFDDPHVSWLLVFIYFELAIAAIVTTLSALKSFAVEFKNDPKSAMIGLGSIVAIIALMGITYAMGDGSKMNIIGYEGHDNEGTWAKMADMFLMTSYVLTFIAVLAIIANPIIKKLK